MPTILAKTGILIFLCAVAACSASDDPSAAEHTGTVLQRVVSGAYSVTTPDLVSSETATVYNNALGVNVVAYNREDLTHEQFDANNRWVSFGAGLVGTAWKVGNASFDLRWFSPPPNWGALWGDPGLGQVPDTGYVYFTTIAVPAYPTYPGGAGAKWPCANWNSSGNCLNFYPIINSDANIYDGGACIGRSTDGGVSFTVSENDCVHDGAFSAYDGGDIAAVKSSLGGGVMAAFNNLGTGFTDVWYAPNPTASFQSIPRPFPEGASGHPRLFAYGRGIYIVEPTGQPGELWLNYWFTHTGHWGSELYPGVWPMRVTNQYSNDLTALPSGCGMTGGPPLLMPFGYDLAVNQVAAGGISVVRVTYVAESNFQFVGGQQRAFMTLNTSQCDISFPGNGCTDLQNAQIQETGGDGNFTNAFQPAVGTGWDYNLGVALWKVTWLETYDWQTCRVGVHHSSINNMGVLGNKARAAADQSPCPARSGYWGDYDRHLGVYQPSGVTTPTFFRSFSDSTDNNGNSQCTRQWGYTSNPLHISQVAMQ
jgi:hypothetical protein